MPPTRRVRTEPIVRVRTGCLTCRRRKKKCDEQRPHCGGCVRNKLGCHWPSHIPGGSRSSLPDIDAGANPVRTDTDTGTGTYTYTDRGEPRPQRASASVSPQTVHAEAPSSPASVVDATAVECESESAALVPMGHYSCPPQRLQRRSSASAPDLVGDDQPTPLSVGDVMPRSLSMLPGCGPDSYQLLSHYLATTADCMANGSTPINPFLVQIVPLAFTSDLLLQLVLTQSAAHRAFRSQNESDEIAQSHYTKALRLFRREVTELIDGKETNPLMLTVGALVMCFTETAKGDMNGTIFDHLSAANSLLTRLLSMSNAAVPKDLKDFVIEYYTYTAAVSMISIDARVSPQLLLNYDLEDRARELLQAEYVGNLAGCWLELLLLIPCIFDLGRQWLMPDHAPSADDIAMFGSLQAQILRWTPYAFVPPEVFLAGRIFQQAILLYLYTALAPFPRAPQGMYTGLVEGAISDAMTGLSQLSATVRINSGLCWPIAVVGSCLSDPAQQGALRERLTTMVSTFGLGNMQRTLLLLEHMWRMPVEETGPWNICRAMEQNQIWISFA